MRITTQKWVESPGLSARQYGVNVFRVIGALALLCTSLQAADEKSPWQGIDRAKLLTPAKAISPGEELLVGFLLSPTNGYHTYWRGPGIVGVATQLHWDLPEGFEAGKILWPPPVKTDMAGITANGYKKEVILLTKIQAPEKLEGETATLKVKAAWMACSKTCHPSIDNFSITLPITTAPSSAKDLKLQAKFDEIIESLPQAPPEGWKFSIGAPAENHIFLEGTIQGLEEDAPESLLFFCDDMQVDSDSPARFEWVDKAVGKFRLHFVRPEFAPSNPTNFSGILCHKDGWEKRSSSCIEISVPWPLKDAQDE